MMTVSCCCSLSRSHHIRVIFVIVDTVVSLEPVESVLESDGFVGVCVRLSEAMQNITVTLTTHNKSGTIQSTETC